MEIIKNIQKKYQFKRLTPKPTKFWTYARVFLLWMVIPFVLLTNYIATRKALKNVKPETNGPYSTVPINYSALIHRQPVWRTPTFFTYAPTFNDNEVDGKNHLTGVQTALNSLFLFVLGQTKEGKKLLCTEQAGKGLMLSLHHTGHISNGYKYSPEGQFINDVKSTSSDTLASVNLAVSLPESDESLLDRYDVMVDKFIDNDMALMEFERPDDIVARELWDSLKDGKKKIKSVNAMFQPDPSLSGEDALVWLASLTLSAKRRGNYDAKELYKKLLWKNGYALLSLFPTRGTVSPKAMYSTYILAKYGNIKERKIWKRIALTQTTLAQNTDYDMLFAGLLYDAFPELLKESEHKSRVSYLHNKLNRVENRENLGYLVNYTLINKVVTQMLAAPPEVTV